MSSRRRREAEGFPFWRAAGSGIIIAGAVGAALLFLHSDVENVDAEARYKGVHRCSPQYLATLTAAATLTVTVTAGAGTDTASPAAATETPTPSGASATPPPSPAGASPVAGAVDTPMSTVGSTVAPTTTVVPPESVRTSLGSEGSSAPFFSQTSPRWGSQEYDHGFQQDVGCGSTIAQCGCAMTSVATVLDLFQVLTTAEGLELNPQTLNEWSDRDAELTSGGWVSRGYSYGNVLWTDANAFSAEAVRTQPGMPTVRYTGWGDGSEDEIRAELEAGRPVVLEVPGHFIAAVALDGDDILINDPYYRDRTTLAAYEGRVRSSRRFEASRDLGGILITVPANLRVRVTDSQGRVTGILDGGAPDKVAKKAKEEIPGAIYRFEEAWRDPTCDEPPPTEKGVNQVFIPNPGKETFQIDVSNPEGGDTTVAIHTYDEAGSVTLETRDADGDNSLGLDYDPKPGGNTKLRQPRRPPSGHFVDETIPRLPPEPGSGQDSAVGDVDGDGDLDIIVAGGRTIYDPRNPKAIFPPTGREPDRLLINDGDGFFRNESAARLPRLSDPSTAVALSDFNGDGHLDVLMANDGEQSRLLVNDGHGFFVDQSPVLLPPEKWRVRTVESADLDGDGDVDLLLATGERPAKGDLSAHLLIAGSPLRDETDRLPPLTGKVVNHLLPFDADGDGDQDVFVSVGGPDPEQPRLWINQGGGQFVDETKSRLPNVKLRAQKAVAGDVDGDGDLDVMVATAGGPVHLLINEGRGVFSNAALDRMPPASINAVDVELADADRDGDLDALVTGSPGGLHLLTNDGAGYFYDMTDEVFPPVLGTLASGSWGDVDGDGDLDIFAPRHNNKLNALLINVDLTPSPTAEAATPTPTPTPTETGVPTATRPPTPGPSATPAIPVTPEIPPTPVPTPTPVPPPTPTPIPPTHTPRPTHTPCPTLDIARFVVTAAGGGGVNVTWLSLGGCSPFQGTLTARLSTERTPYAQWTVTEQEGSEPDYPPCPAEGQYSVEYRIVLNDASGQTASRVTSYTYSCVF